LKATVQIADLCDRVEPTLAVFLPPQVDILAGPIRPFSTFTVDGARERVASGHGVTELS
jgi:hypothetical protein